MAKRPKHPNPPSGPAPGRGSAIIGSVAMHGVRQDVFHAAGLVFGSRKHQQAYRRLCFVMGQLQLAVGRAYTPEQSDIIIELGRIAIERPGDEDAMKAIKALEQTGLHLQSPM